MTWLWGYGISLYLLKDVQDHAWYPKASFRMESLDSETVHIWVALSRVTKPDMKTAMLLLQRAARGMSRVYLVFVDRGSRYPMLEVCRRLELHCISNQDLSHACYLEPPVVAL